MAIATVRKVGNTLMLEIPSDIQRKLHLLEGSQVQLEGEEKKLMLRRPAKYSLDELLSQCDFSQPMSEEEREWIDSPAVGRELI